MRVKISFRRASMTGRAPGAPAASASRVETPATCTSSASPNARAAARPIRSPVKLPGPVPATMPFSSVGPASACSRSSFTSSSRRPGSPTRSPSVSPSSTRALVATLVAVSNARINTFELNHPVVGSRMPQLDAEPRRGQRLARRLRPLDEADRAVEIGLEIAPLGRRDALEAIQIEMGHVHVSTVPMADGVSRARHRALDAECVTGTADECRLARAELARDGDHVSGPQLSRELRGDALRLLGRGRLEHGACKRKRSLDQLPLVLAAIPFAALEQAAFQPFVLGCQSAARSQRIAKAQETEPVWAVPHDDVHDDLAREVDPLFEPAFPRTRIVNLVLKAELAHAVDRFRRNLDRFDAYRYVDRGLGGESR